MEDGNATGVRQSSMLGFYGERVCRRRNQTCSVSEGQQAQLLSYQCIHIYIYNRQYKEIFCIHVLVYSNMARNEQESLGQVLGRDPALRSAGGQIPHGPCWQILWSRRVKRLIHFGQHMFAPWHWFMPCLSQVCAICRDQPLVFHECPDCSARHDILEGMTQKYMRVHLNSKCYVSTCFSSEKNRLEEHDCGIQRSNCAQILRQRLLKKLVWAHTAWAPQRDQDTALDSVLTGLV